MANRFWVGDGGNWSDNANHWSASDGGAPNASKPTSSDSVFFTASSFTAGAQTVTLDEAANCLDMVWTGATNTPTLAGASNLSIYGSLTFIAAMTLTHTGLLIFRATSVGKTITTAQQLASHVEFSGGDSGGWTLQDDLNLGQTKHLYMRRGTLDTNGKEVTCSTFHCDVTTARTLTLGASVLNCTRWNVSNATNFTLNANTSTIKVTGTGAFTGAGLTYNDVELNGTAHTISGSNTFATLTLKAATTQTITFTDGTTQVITTPVFTGSSGKIKTLVGTSTAGWTIIKADGGTVDANYLALSYSTATPGQTWYTANSTDTVGNSGWIFAWTGKFSGVTNPAKINGIAVRTIQKVNGVT